MQIKAQHKYIAMFNQRRKLQCRGLLLLIQKFITKFPLTQIPKTYWHPHNLLLTNFYVNAHKPNMLLFKLLHFFFFETFCQYFPTTKLYKPQLGLFSGRKWPKRIRSLTTWVQAQYLLCVPNILPNIHACVPEAH